MSVGHTVGEGMSGGERSRRMGRDRELESDPWFDFKRACVRAFVRAACVRATSMAWRTSFLQSRMPLQTSTKQYAYKAGCSIQKPVVCLYFVEINIYFFKHVNFLKTSFGLLSITLGLKKYLITNMVFEVEFKGEICV